jgi:hypothetical protein
MTAKEKAKELIRQFYSVGAIECKQCALVAVIEILNKDGYNNDYWKEVKAEIKNL